MNTIIAIILALNMILAYAIYSNYALSKRLDKAFELIGALSSSNELRRKLAYKQLDSRDKEIASLQGQLNKLKTVYSGLIVNLNNVYKELHAQLDGVSDSDESTKTSTGWDNGTDSGSDSGSDSDN